MDLKNIFKKFFSDISGFLFYPFATLERYMEQDEKAGNLIPYIYIFYMSVLLGVTMWFFIFYPEPLYYGTSGADLQREIPAILIANPLHSLLVVTAGVFGVIFIYTYLAVGSLSYAVMKLLRKDDSQSLGSYLGYYAYAFTPLLFWIPAMVFRAFFFERWVHLRPMWPFFDWTLLSALHLLVLLAFFLWKLIIEVRINQAFFRVSALKAAVPVLVQSCLLALLLVFPLTLNDLFFKLLQHGLT